MDAPIYKNGVVTFRDDKPIRKWTGNILSFGLTSYIRKKRRNRLRKKILSQITRRREEEARGDLGTRVWFSRHISRGRLKHWALLVDGRKYELRRVDSPEKTKKPKYEFRVTPRPIDAEKRQAALSQRFEPVVDGFWVCLIGWTNFSAENLQVTGNDVFAELFKGKTYNIVLNNCQKFLKRFADRVVSSHAIDWKWFRKNVDTTYRKDLGKYQKPPPRAIVDMQIDFLLGLTVTGAGIGMVQMMSTSEAEVEGDGAAADDAGAEDLVTPEDNIGADEALIESGVCLLDSASDLALGCCGECLVPCFGSCSCSC